MHIVHAAPGILVLLLVTMSCGNARQSPGDAASAEAETADVEVADVEAVPAAGMRVPPGTARLQATVASCDEDATRHACTLTARQVVGYGAGADPVAAGDTLHVYFPKASFKQGLTDILQPESDVEVSVRRDQYPGYEASPPTYTAVGLH